MRGIGERESLPMIHKSYLAIEMSLFGKKSDLT